jgi:hypothetical protein
MKVLDTLSLARRCCLQLVEIDGRQVLVGYDAGGLRSVTPLVASFAEQCEEEEELAGATIQASRGR